MGAIASAIVLSRINAPSIAYDLTSLDRLYSRVHMLASGGELAKFGDINLRHKLTLISRDSSKVKEINIVLIIGESSNRHHYSLYGYDLETTPRLDGLFRAGDIIKFSDVISPDIATVPSLTKVLTTLHRSEEGRWQVAPNIMDIFMQAGFKTFWVSNQESKSIFKNYRLVYTDIAQMSDFMAATRSNLEGTYNYQRVDGRLLPLLAPLAPLTPKSLLVIHLLGQHVAYDGRYTREFAKFDAGSYKGLKRSHSVLEQRGYYDNAILYGDYILDTIYKDFADKNTIIVFFSDHSEEVGDAKDGFLHRRLSRATVEIPFLVMSTPAFRASHRGLMRRLEAAKDAPFMTDDLLYFLMSIANIHYKELEEKMEYLSPLQPRYSPKDRVVQSLRYDK